MTLRMRLAFALVLAALLPMLLGLGIAMLQAGRRASQEADRRLEAVVRQARLLVDLHSRETRRSVELAARDLAANERAIRALLGGSTAEAIGIAPSLAERYRLDYLEIVNADGVVLSTLRPDRGVGLRSALVGVTGEMTVGLLPARTEEARGRLAHIARVTVPREGEHLEIVAALESDEKFLGEVAEVTGEPVTLIDGLGAIAATAGGDPGSGVRSGHAPAGPSGSASDPERTVASSSSDHAAADSDRATPSGEGEAAASGEGEATAGGKANLPGSRGGINRVARGGVPDGVSASSPDRLRARIPLRGGPWSLEVSVPAGDTAEVRRQLFAALAGIAPLALACALILGIVLADRISRPIRALAGRAEQISAEHAGTAWPITVPRERDEVRRLTRAFDRMLDALSESEAQRLVAERIAAWKEVARRIAHEVKNPLSPIKLAVENLRRTREKAPADLDRALEEETKTILEEVESLRRLVDEFSQFARLPAPQLAPCDPRQIVGQALALFAPRIESLGVRVTFSPAPGALTALADAEQLGRALKNVIANALDAMEGTADRRLSVIVGSWRGGRGAMVEIEIRDNGPGFGEEALRRVFEPYYTTRSDHGGTGLGMAIAHRIITDHGGTIRVGGSPGRGAIVTIRLPASSAAATDS